MAEDTLFERPAVAGLGPPELVALFDTLVSDRGEISRAQALVADEASREAARAATVAEIDDALEEAVSDVEQAAESGTDGRVLLGAGLAVSAALGGALVALKKRGGAEGEAAEKALEDASVSRREMLALIGLGGLGLGAGGVLLRSQLPAAAQTAESSGLNVLAIVIDDLNDYPTFMGGAPMPVHTPNLDALAAQSRVYMNHHVTVPICPPSRATLMWGLDVRGHGMTDRILDDYDAFSAATPGSLPEVVRSAGMQTIGGGKLFHFAQEHLDAWDQFLPTQYATAERTAVGSFDYGPLVDDRNPDRDLVDFMTSHLDGLDPSRPFLMMPGIRLPHLPWRVPQQYLDLYPIDDIVLPETPEDDWSDLGPVATAQLEQYIKLYGAGWFEIVERDYDRAQLMRAYLAGMSHTDAMVGRLLESLEASPFADNTVVMLVSDNGYHQGENFAYRKLTLRNQATRTPFMVRPVEGSGFTAGPVEQVVSSTSFMPTVLDVLGVTSPSPLAGTSLRNDAQPAALITTHVDNSVSLVFGGSGGGRWTLHFSEDQPFDAASVSLDDAAEMEFYDHATDPQEFANLLP